MTLVRIQDLEVGKTYRVPNGMPAPWSFKVTYKRGRTLKIKHKFGEEKITYTPDEIFEYSIEPI